MNIEDKRLLSARPGKLTLLREGLFLRCYQQSLFTLVHTVYPDIKILGRAAKKLKEQVVYYGGFPPRVLHNLLPESVATPWGAEVDCDVLVEGAYLAWLAALPSPSEMRAGTGSVALVRGRKARYLQPCFA
ncbi:hypothetical protein SMETH2_34470 [Serratia marcescens]|uniref:hypothetical protein n=1 Tax=Serratia ureilytica TaxID=300181 RepID=UPI0019D15B37|nr:hypothetical protein [Serratia ureilytica]MBN5226942.1 hypothetical protein [Serratia ureilytica]BEN03316.1 hypothetical protein SMETH2_34470 [Serratia marcescens]